MTVRLRTRRSDNTAKSVVRTKYFALAYVSPLAGESVILILDVKGAICFDEVDESRWLVTTESVRERRVGSKIPTSGEIDPVRFMTANEMSENARAGNSGSRYTSKTRWCSVPIRGVWEESS